MKKFLFYSLTLLAGLIIFIFVVSQVGSKQIGQTIALFSYWKWGLIVIIGLLSFFIGVMRWRFIIKTITGRKISFRLVTMAKTIGWMIAYVTPIAYIGGEPHKTYFLKEEAGLEWEPAGASVFIDEVLDLSMALLFLIIGAVFLFLKFSVPPILIVILGGTIATCLTLWYLFYRQTNNEKGFISFFVQLLNLNKIKWVNHIQERLRKAEDQTAHFFKNHRKAFALALSLAFLERLILIVDFWLIVVFLGSQITPVQIMAIMALAVAVYFLPLPASLGGNEAGQAIIFQVFGFGAHTGLVFSLIIRILSLGGVLIGLLFLLRFEAKLVKQKIAHWGARLNGFFDRQTK